MTTNTPNTPIKVYDGGDFGSESFATTDIESVWNGYAEAADFRQYENADDVESQTHVDFVSSFVDFDPNNEWHITLAKRAGLL